MARKGFTLVEAVVVMAILGLIAGAIMSFYPVSAKLFVRGSAEATAETAAARATQKIAPVVREAVNLNVVVRNAGTGDVRLEVSLPLKQVESTTGENLVVYPLAVGEQVAYYRSDASGSSSQTGNYLWEAVKVGGNWQPRRPLAENVSSFTCPRVDTFSPKGVEVVIACLAKEGSRQGRVTHRQYLECRNT